MRSDGFGVRMAAGENRNAYKLLGKGSSPFEMSLLVFLFFIYYYLFTSKDTRKPILVPKY